MVAPLPTITNTVGVLANGYTVQASDWNTAVGGIYTYINSTLLAAGLNKMTAKGDLLSLDGGSTIQALNVGADNTILVADSSQTTGMRWGASPAIQLTTPGDLLIYGATVVQRLPIGTEGQILQVTSGLPAWGTNASGVPIGGIILWSGSIATIPANYQLCNGLNGTINLQGLFVVGAGNQSPGATGGMGLLNPGGPSGDDSAGAGLGPSHTHALGQATTGAGSAAYFAHGTNTAAATVTPKYYALCYIQRMT